MSDETLWRVEEAFWTGGDEAYRDLDPACLMVFPGVGILDAGAARDGLKQEPRWTGVTMTDQRLGRPADGLATLTYRARGERAGSAPYEAWCSSSYRREGQGWRLFQHQQTPI